MRGFRHLNSTSMIGTGLAFLGLLAPPAEAGRVWWRRDTHWTPQGEPGRFLPWKFAQNQAQLGTMDGEKGPRTRHR